MKKGLFLLTSLLITGTAVTPLLSQTKTQDAAIQEQTKSLDVLDLTMPWWGNVKADTPNLTQLLNDSVGKSLQTSLMILTAPDGTVIESESSFDNSGLRGILGYDQVHFTEIKLEVSGGTPYANYLMAQYSYVEKDEVKNSSRVINRFDWRGIDMAPFWTKDVKLEFELNF
ncbi:hypothetical protein [Spiroplasma platyhelix]|uniref:Uncharacterized protein n=1 Tax=Spiroplasma platyhelix PALS-1 TaxID=1276218 RepID=A0A846TX93_9MOLU|nr:hypothetical protein [Spiroplasma platyhelix]MBE4704309.1 hypothetical protein [Spiroplasma platyhelix PALS-1]NKE38681.1 hypothetical protein [Spiroplasma platyhelix PALS-1]UJB28893.1 hypothetical protein SPLAT_v1c01260 [Spiroplasma platyhelix PALS-1]